LRPYTKPSSRLLQLREQERSMGIARMYSQAKDMKMVADRLQRKETQAAQTRIAQQMAVERQKLSLRHQREAQALEVYKERTIRAIRNEKLKELRPILTALRQIKAKKTAPKRNPFTPMREENSLLAVQDNLASPKAAKRFAQFRAEKKTTLLDVGPVDDQLLAQMKKPTVTRTKSVLTARRKI